MRQYDPLIGWFTRLPRTDQWALVRLCEENGHTRLARALEWTGLHGILVKDWLVVMLWEEGLKDMWRTAKGKALSDARYLTEKGRRFAETVDQLGEGAVEAVQPNKSRNPLNGLHIQTRHALLELAREQCLSGDCADWNAYTNGADPKRP